MYPILFRIGPITIYSYGLALAVAFILSTHLARKEALRNNVPPDIILELSSYILIGGIIGARILYVWINFSQYREFPLEILMIQHGGLSFYGGAAGAFLTSVLFLKKRKLSFAGITDLLSPFIALGQAIGRVGCLLRGCCFGKITTFWLKIRFPDELVYRHPTQIYASLIDLALFFLLRYLYRKRHFRGKLFLLYLMLYSLKRIFLDFLRADVERIYMGLTIFQILSLVIFIFSFTTLVFQMKPRLIERR